VVWPGGSLPVVVSLDTLLLTHILCVYHMIFIIMYSQQEVGEHVSYKHTQHYSEILHNTLIGTDDIYTQFRAVNLNN